MRLIDADALVSDFMNYADLEFDGEGVANFISHAPTVDAVPMVHGRWIGTHDGWYYSYSCSECGAEALTKEETMHDQVCSAYCPYCGTRMDGGKND